MRRTTAVTPLTPHPEAERLTEALARCAAAVAPWSGTIFRFVGQHYANQRDLLTGEGSRVAGARWNPKGDFPAVYGALAPETALAEALAFSRRQGLPDEEALPRTLVGIRLTLQRLLDLTRGELRRTLGVSERRMREEPWRTIQEGGREAMTQAIGRLARTAGVEGLLVPSAASRGCQNLVYFPDVLQVGSTAEIVHATHLPRRRRRNRGDR
jgi:RES domain-containing protein